MIALYKGTSLISRIIRIRTWSVYSHASYIFDDNSEIEAWPGGVAHLPHWGQQHKPGTVVDLYDYIEPLQPGNKLMLETFLRAQVGKDYDYSGVGGFLPMLRLFGIHNNFKKWFCFELVTFACNVARATFTNVPPYKVDGDIIAGSVVLRYVGSRIVPDYTRKVQLQTA